MRRLVGLFVAIMTLMVLPLAPAAAQEERVEAVVVAEESPVGIAADGATLTSGTYALLFQGIVIETGTVEGRYYDRGTGVKGTRHFVNDANGATAVTEVKARVVSVDPTGTIIRYRYQESIISSSEGVTGHGRGRALFTIFEDGSFLLETSTHVILDLP